MFERDMPLISIVTPTYNRADYIEDTIQSVVNQSYRNIEYIIMDGCSSDNTLEILEKHKNSDNRIRYTSEKDEGMYDAINKGFSVAKGDILAYINSDDLYAPEVFGVVVEYFDKHPEIDVVYGDTLVIEKGKGIHINIYMPYPEIWLRAGGIIAQPTVFMRRQCWDKVGNLRQDVKYLGDCEYWLRLIKNSYHLGKINEVLAIEVNHGDTLRNTMQNEIEGEKRFLQKRYWIEVPLKENIRWLVLFSRKALTPFWHVYFILKINMKMTKGSWGKFISHYRPEASLGRYLLNKIFKSNLDVWAIDAPKINTK